MLDPFNPNVNAFTQQLNGHFMQSTGDPARSQEMTWQALANLREQQAASLAYFDVFWVLACIAVGLVVLVLFMKRSVAEKGAHVAAD